MDSAIRQTKIVATVGPASDEPDVLRQMLRSGVDVVRLNFSHASHDYARTMVRRTRSIAEEINRPVAILQDLCGPKIRVGQLYRGHVELEPGQRIVITTRAITGNAESISTNYEGFARDVKPGDRILLDDGQIEFRAVSTSSEEVVAEVVFGGTLLAHKGINLPGVELSCPSLTAKDAADLVLGIELDVDFVALSFVRSGDDMKHLRSAMGDNGADIPIIAKIEKPEALDDLDEILAISDGIMVARGDLGVELGAEQVPIAQKNIISEANQLGVPVITATQMLESMTEHPRPTRAEASDVANAILDGTDAVMLSAETSIGRYPSRSVRTMAEIAVQVEASEPYARKLAASPLRGLATFEDAAADAACHAAHTIDARAIVVFSMSGRTASEVAQRRPDRPIFALTPEQSTYRRLAMMWGVRPAIVPQAGDAEEQLRLGECKLLELGLVQSGDILVVVVGNTPATGATDTIRIHRVTQND